MGAGGGITNVSTSITDMIKTKNYKKEIESIGNERKEIAKELGGHLDFLNHVALELEKNGLDKDSAYKVAFTYAKFGYNTFMFKKDALTIATGIIDSIKLGKGYFVGLFLIVNDFILTFCISAESVSMSGTVATSIGYVTLAGGKTVKMEFGTTFLLTNTLSKLGIEMGRTAKDVLGTLVTGVSVIFMVTDIVFLVKDWQSEHPTIEYLDNIIKTLQEELEPIKELFKFFNTNNFDNKLTDNNQSSADEKELNESLTKLQEKLEKPIDVDEYDIIDNNNNDNNSNKLR